MKLPAFMIIAKKEIMDNFRNLWIILVTIIFAALALVVSYFGSLGRGWQDLELTIAGMMYLVNLLIPIIALMLGYASIVREIEKGSMNSLLSHPVDRWEIIIGKFLGLGGVLSLSIFIGFGFSGIIIGILASNVNYVAYLIFIISSILLGLVYLSLSMMFSVLFKKRSSSMGMAIFIWFFFAIIWEIISAGLIFITGGSFFDVPSWYFIFQLINPIVSFQLLIILNVVPAGGEITLSQDWPSFYTSELMVLILFIWILVPMLLSFIFFEKRDI